MGSIGFARSIAGVTAICVRYIDAINQIKSVLNVDDKAPDELTIEIDLSGLDWKLWDKPHLIEKWKGLLA